VIFWEEFHSVFPEGYESVDGGWYGIQEVDRMMNDAKMDPEAG